MTKTFLAGVIGTALMLSPLTFAQRQDGAQRQDNTQTRRSSEQVSRTRADSGVQRAIEFERSKNRAAERQARLEARHPSVSYSNADRRMDDSTPGNQVRDTGPGKVKKDH